MKKFMILLVALAFISSAAVAVVAADKGPAEVKMPTKMGEITFNHTAHQGRTECATCHHAGVEAGACRSCHGAKADAPKSKKAFHKTCKGCHKKTDGPTKCKGCHVK